MGTPPTGDAVPVVAAGGASADAVESFEAWASRHRQRATRDGAWKVEVKEWMVRGEPIRSVISWHDNARQLGTPLRRAQQQGGDEPVEGQRQQAARAQSASSTHRADVKAAAQHFQECGTSQVEETPACSAQGAARACDALPCTTVAFDGEDVRAARHPIAGQAPPLSTA